MNNYFNSAYLLREQPETNMAIQSDGMFNNPLYSGIGKCLATLSKEEILVELEKRNLDSFEVCLLGGIEPEPEYLCKILHFCMEVD